MILAEMTPTTLPVDPQPKTETFVIRMEINHIDKCAEKITCKSREDLESVIVSACSTFAHGELYSQRGRELPVRYEVLDGRPDRILRLIKDLEAMPYRCGLTVNLAPDEATTIAAGAIIVRFEPKWLSERGDEAKRLRTGLDEEEPSFPYSHSLAELEEFASGASPSEGDPSGLLSGDHYHALLCEFAWWINAADALLPALQHTGDRDKDGYIAPEFHPQRDRLLALESDFWKVLPGARRYAVWGNGCNESVDEGLERSLELLRKYFAYRSAVLGLARIVVSPDLCERLEKRI